MCETGSQNLIFLGLVGSGSTSFPLVLGRDVSGTVVDSGGDAKSGF